MYYDRIDISKGIDPTKSNQSKEYTICHYWLLNHGFKFQDSVCNGCHNLTMLCLNTSDITIRLLKMLITAALFITLALWSNWLLESFVLENRR